MTRYRTIVADPPWPSPFGKLGASHRANPNAHYGTTGLDWIGSLPVRDMAEDSSAAEASLPRGERSPVRDLPGDRGTARPSRDLGDGMKLHEAIDEFIADMRSQGRAA